jgi:ClpP class serine protease
MALAERLKLYAELEEARNNRPLIVYVTSPRLGAGGEMAADAIPELTDQTSRLPAETDGLDLLIVSDGGDPTVAWRAVTLLRERVKKLAVLIPQAAYSAATLLALGADEIVMHPNGNLGPVDPQLSVKKQGETEGGHFGFEDMTGFLEFARKEVGLTDCIGSARTGTLPSRH